MADRVSGLLLSIKFFALCMPKLCMNHSTSPQNSHFEDAEHRCIKLNQQVYARLCEKSPLTSCMQCVDKQFTVWFMDCEVG